MPLEGHNLGAVFKYGAKGRAVGSGEQKTGVMKFVKSVLYI